MYRTSESISQVGAELLLDIMYCSRSIYCLFNFGDSWISVECKVLAITNEQLMVSYKTREDWPVLGLQEGVKLSWINIANFEGMWFTDKNNAEFEAVYRNENTEG